jgi:hypothetical protein
MHMDDRSLQEEGQVDLRLLWAAKPARKSQSDSPLRQLDRGQKHRICQILLAEQELVGLVCVRQGYGRGVGDELVHEGADVVHQHVRRLALLQGLRAQVVLPAEHLPPQQQGLPDLLPV